MFTIRVFEIVCSNCRSAKKPFTSEIEMETNTKNERLKHKQHI